MTQRKRILISLGILFVACVTYFGFLAPRQFSWPGP